MMVQRWMGWAAVRSGQKKRPTLPTGTSKGGGRSGRRVFWGLYGLQSKQRRVSRAAEPAKSQSAPLQAPG